MQDSASYKACKEDVVQASGFSSQAVLVTVVIVGATSQHQAFVRLHLGKGLYQGVAALFGREAAHEQDVAIFAQSQFFDQARWLMHGRLKAVGYVDRFFAVLLRVMLGQGLGDDDGGMGQVASCPFAKFEIAARHWPPFGPVPIQPLHGDHHFAPQQARQPGQGSRTDGLVVEYLFSLQQSV